jgi:hypothetical protein
MPEDSINESSSSGGSPRSRWTSSSVRWWLALLIAVAAALYFFHSVGKQSICQHNVSANPSAFSESCGPPRLLDLVPFGILIAVLLWPDLSEMSVAGLLTLKRRVRRQEARQEGLEESLASVQQHLVQLSVASQNQSQAAAANVYLYPPDQDDVRRGIVEKEGVIPPPNQENAVQGQQNDRQALFGEFLQEYARLEPYIWVPGMRRFSKRLEDLPDQHAQLVEQWNELFSNEISALRQTRNVVVHEPERVSEATLQGALDNTRSLWRILSVRLALEPEDNEEDA